MRYYDEEAFRLLEECRPFLVRNGAFVKIKDDAPEEIKKKYQRALEIHKEYKKLSYSLE